MGITDLWQVDQTSGGIIPGKSQPELLAAPQPVVLEGPVKCHHSVSCLQVVWPVARHGLRFLEIALSSLGFYIYAF